MEKRRTKREIAEIRKLYGVAQDLGITIFLVDEDNEMLEGSGGIYLAPDEIYVPTEQTASELILSLAHELGHAISELRGEIPDEFHDIYELAYPEQEGDEADEQDKEIIRFIEARAVYHANKLLDKLQVKVSKSRRDIDNLYTMLSLESILDYGILEDDDIDHLYEEVRAYLSDGETWDQLYERFFLDRG